MYIYIFFLGVVFVLKFSLMSWLLKPHASKILQYNTRIIGVNVMKIMLQCKMHLNISQNMNFIYAKYMNLLLWFDFVMKIWDCSVIKYVSWIECISWLGWSAIALVSAVSQACSISLHSWKMNSDRAGQFFLAAVQGFRAAHVRRGLGTEWVSHTQTTLSHNGTLTPG